MMRLGGDCLGRDSRWFRQVHQRELGRVDHDRDVSDPAVDDGEREDRERDAVLAPGNGPGRPLTSTARPCVAALADSCAPAATFVAPRGDDHAGRSVDGRFHLGVEYPQQLLEVAAASRCQEGLDYLSLLPSDAGRLLNRLHWLCRSPDGRRSLSPGSAGAYVTCPLRAHVRRPQSIFIPRASAHAVHCRSRGTLVGSDERKA